MLGSFFKKKETEEEPKPLIYLYNTETSKKDVFLPRVPEKVSLYSCGPTVYDYVHIGNIRSYVFSDTLKRMLVANGYVVDHVINITDFGHLTSDADSGEDKMMKALGQAGKEISVENMLELATDYLHKFIDDLELIHIHTKGIRFPRASEHVDGMVAINKTLEEKGYAYETSDGLYFDTARFPTYGRLGNIKLDEQKEGTRLEVNDEKHNPADFALWKKNTEMGWESPWGRGFPGWHVECTAMIFATLGKQIDIHTGGIDHIAVHHNNEIAQAESISGKKYVKYWMHNDFIKIEGKKISKSLGNTIRLDQIVARHFSPLAYRYLLLTSHYRSPANFTWEALEASQKALFKIQRHFCEDLPERTGETIKAYWDKFLLAINDDLDTAKAIAIVWELIKDTSPDKKDKRATFLEMDKVLCLGLNQSKKKIKEMLSINVVPLTDMSSEVKELVEKREKARENKDWDEADAIRKQINDLGYEVKDTPKGFEVSKSAVDL